MRTEFPDRLKKMKAMEGDLGLPGLGLSPENRTILVNEVSVVFNGAASLRLEAGLKDAIRHNTTGTKHVLDLAVEMKNLVVGAVIIIIIIIPRRLSVRSARDYRRASLENIDPKRLANRRRSTNETLCTA